MLTMRRGTVGPQVRDLQIALNGTTEAGLILDGKFGPATEEAVRTFQAMFNLSIDGIVGKKTGACLVAACFCGTSIYQRRTMAKRRRLSSQR